MEYTIQYLERPNYLLAHVHSPNISPEVSETYSHRVGDKCRETGYDMLILMRDIPATLERAAFYKATDEWRRPFDGIRVAWLNPYPRNRFVLEYVIELANSRGSNFHLFSRYDCALDWIKNEKSTMESDTSIFHHSLTDTAWDFHK